MIDYSTKTDADVVTEVMAQYAMTQETLAEILLINRSNLSRVKNGRIGLRPAVRRKLEEMLTAVEEAESGQFQIEELKPNEAGLLTF